MSDVKPYVFYGIVYHNLRNYNQYMLYICLLFLNYIIILPYLVIAR